MLVLTLALAAATPHPGQILAGPAFERFARSTDQACAGRQLRAITPGDLDWEEEAFEDQLSPNQRNRLTAANRLNAACARSEGGLSCPTTETLAAMERTGMLPAFGHFACTHVVPATMTVRQAAAALPTAAAILPRLDLDSFPNSTGPRRRPTLHTPADYGLIETKSFDDGWTQVSAPGDGWHMSALVLDASPNTATLCFLDTGGRGATYRATQVLRVDRQADSRWTALQIADRADCRNRPSFVPGGTSGQEESHGVPTFIPHHTMPPSE